MLGRDLRSAVRYARRRPQNTLLAVVTFAVGLGASAALTSLTVNVILPAPTWPDAERLVVLQRTGQPTTGGDPDALHWSVWSALSETTVLEDVAASLPVELVTRDPDGQFEVLSAQYVSSNWLRLLGVQLAGGRQFSPPEDERSENVALISFALWQRRYGGAEDVVGRTMRLSYTNPRAPIGTYRVVGVLPKGFEFEGRSMDVLLPLGLVPAGWRLSPQPVVRILGKLHSGATVPRTLENLEGALTDLSQVSEGEADRPLQLVRVVDSELREARTDGWLLIAAAGSLLLLSLMNYLAVVGLDTWRRSGEYSLRMAMGATMQDLRWTWIAEGVLHGAAAGLVGTVIGYWLNAAAIAELTEMPDAQPGFTGFDAQAAALVAAGGMVLTVVAGLVFREFQISKGWPARLRPAGSGAGRGGQGLLVASLAVTLVLLFASAVLTQSVVLRSNRALGFDSQNLVFVTVGAVLALGDPPVSESQPMRPRTRIGLTDIEALRREAALARQAVNDARTAMVFDAVRSVPGVRSVAAVSGAPLFGAPVSTSVLTSSAGDRLEPALEVGVTAEYFNTMRIQTRRGRTFETQDRFAGAVVVSSEFERRYLDGNAEGRTFRIIPFQSVPESARPAAVIGVVDDVYLGRQSSRPAPVYYRLGATADGIPRGIVVRLEEGVHDVGAILKARIEEAAPGTLVTMTSTFEDRLALELVEARRRGTVAGLFALLALAVSCVAVWATVTRIGLERTTEIALRLAIGASAGNVYRLLGREYFRSVAPGLLLGIAGAVVVAQIFRSHFTSSVGLDVGALVAACFLLACVQALAMVMPARRAARVDPMRVLRDG